MFIRPGYCCKFALDKYASDAPMFTVPVAASVMPVPDPVPPVVMVTIGSPAELTNCFWYAVAQVPNSGNKSVLPVSVSDVGVLSGLVGRAAPFMGADLFEEPEPPEFEPELQAAASTANGTRAAAVQAKRFRLATGEYSFTCACLCMRQTTRTRLRAMGPRFVRGFHARGEEVAFFPTGGLDMSAESSADIVGGFFLARVLEDLPG